MFICSCAVNADFSKRKYLNLKAPIFQHQEAKATNTSNTSTFFEPELDKEPIEKWDIYMESADLEEKISISIPDEKETSKLDNDSETMTTIVPIDPIIVDSTDVNEDIQKPIEKEKRTKDPKRAARIILGLLLSIAVATAGILGGIQIMRVNAPDGTFLSSLWFFFIAIGAIALMLVATIIALFLIISVFDS